MTPLHLAGGAFVIWVLVYASAIIDRSLIGLATASSAPLIGLIGAIIGMEGIKAFRGSKRDE